MTNVRVARRYAEAMVGMADEQKKSEAISGDFATLRQLISGSREFLLFLQSPVINKTRKRTVLRSLFEGKLEPATTRFLDVIAEKGRENLLADIIDQFFALQDERQGIVNVTVKTASDFSGDQTAMLTKKLETYTNKRVRVSFSLDSLLKGGFVARVGDTVFDGSVKRQLELLRQRFTEGNGANQES